MKIILKIMMMLYLILYYDFLFNFDWLKQLIIEDQHILEYSLEYGFFTFTTCNKTKT